MCVYSVDVKPGETFIFFSEEGKEALLFVSVIQ